MAAWSYRAVMGGVAAGAAGVGPRHPRRRSAQVHHAPLPPANAALEAFVIWGEQRPLQQGVRLSSQSAACIMAPLHTSSSPAFIIAPLPASLSSPAFIKPPLPSMALAHAQQPLPCLLRKSAVWLQRFTPVLPLIPWILCGRRPVVAVACPPSRAGKVGAMW